MSTWGPALTTTRVSLYISRYGEYNNLLSNGALL